MVIARMTFKEEMADYWVDQPKGSDRVRTVVEVAFEDASALIDTVKQVEDALVDCVAIVQGRMVALSDFKV